MIDFNSQYTPASAETTPEEPRRRKTFVSIVLIVIILVSAVGVFVLYKYKFEKPTSPATTGAPAPTQLNQTTKDFFTNYSKTLLTFFTIDSADPLSLDTQSKAKLQTILDFAKTSPTTAVFDGVPYKDIQLVQKDNSYYISPNNQPDSGLLVIDKESIALDEFISTRTDIDKYILTTLFNARKAMSNASYVQVYNSAKTKIEKYLDSQVAAKTITKYTYDNTSDTLDLYYPDYPDIPYQTEPLHLIDDVLYVMNSYQNPSQYANTILANYKQEMSQGQILVINTKADPGSNDVQFFPKSSFTSDLTILLDDKLAKEQKLTNMAGNMRVFDSYDTTTTNDANTSGFLGTPTALADSNTPQQLLARDGAIVPPSKDFIYFIGPDHDIANESDKELCLTGSCQSIHDKSSASFGVFLQNNYSVKFFLSKWGEQSVGNIAEMLSDQDAETVLWNAHGSIKGELQAEVYDLGIYNPESKNDTYRAKLTQRVSDLREEYGNDSISVVYSLPLISDEERDNYLSGKNKIAPDLRYLLDSRNSREIGVIFVTKEFIQKYSKPKSIFILKACYGGSLSKSIKARVFLAPSPISETGDKLFDSDLNKIGVYLFQDYQEIAGKKPDITTMRSYSTYKDFKYGLVALNANTNEDEIKQIVDCMSKLSSICTIDFPVNSITGNKTTVDNTVAVSPNVSSATGALITFNAPMENTEDYTADKIVSIDASQCKNIPKGAIDNATKPEWDNSDGFGDKQIKLSWNDVVYQDWQDSDFDASGNPAVPYAVITVKNDKAVSAVSKINITGNPDCVSKDGVALHLECWKDPATVEYNGNTPNTDFVYSMPCVKEDEDKYLYYRTCGKNSCEGGEVIKVLRAPWVSWLKDIATVYPQRQLPVTLAGLGHCYLRIDNASEEDKNNAINMEGKLWADYHSGQGGQTCDQFGINK